MEGSLPFEREALPDEPSIPPRPPAQLPRVVVKSDVHCVTRWSRFDNLWEGVSVQEILRRVNVRPDAVTVMGYHLRADPWREERYSDQETHAMQRMRAEAARRCAAAEERRVP